MTSPRFADVLRIDRQVTRTSLGSEAQARYGCFPVASSCPSFLKYRVERGASNRHQASETSNLQSTGRSGGDNPLQDNNNRNTRCITLEPLDARPLHCHNNKGIGGKT